MPSNNGKECPPNEQTTRLHSYEHTLLKPRYLNKLYLINFFLVSFLYLLDLINFIPSIVVRLTK